MALLERSESYGELQRVVDYVYKNGPIAERLDVIIAAETFDIHADNSPGIDVQEVRISLYTKGSYTKEKNALIKLLLSHDFTVTGRSYIGYETETGYHHYNVDVAHYYEMED